MKAARSLEGGFADPAIQSAHVFRAVMEAVARPGTVLAVAGAAPPPPLSLAAGAVVLTLCDTDTPIHLAGSADCKAVRAWIAFHTGAPFAGPEGCHFAVGTWPELVTRVSYPLGTPDYPDRSATLIVDGTDFNSPATALVGPGIRDVAYLPLPDPDFFRANGRHFPLGLDFILTGGDRVAALPRSTTIDNTGAS